MTNHTLSLPACIGLLAISLLASCTTPKTAPKTTSGAPPKPSATSASTDPASQGPWKFYEKGIASWYGGYWHKRLTANGERYNQYSMTAAHKKLPFNTKVKVTNLRNGKSTIVRINNRGPFVKGRVIDLSITAAKEIGSYSRGIAPVTLEIQKK